MWIAVLVYPKFINEMVQMWWGLEDLETETIRTSDRVWINIISHTSNTFLHSLEYTARLFDGPGKINQQIDLDSPKVATMDKLEAGGKKVYCRCWQSGTFPLCDGSHMAHNKETGDNVGPLIVSVDKAE